MEIYTASEARKNLFKIIDHTNEIHEPVTITTKRKNVVMLAEDDWKNIQETIYLMNDKNLWRSIIEASEEKIEDCLPLDEFKW